MCAQLSKHKVLLSLREGAGEGGDVMCSQTMMSSVETLQGFKVTKTFFPPLTPWSSASGVRRRAAARLTGHSHHQSGRKEKRKKQQQQIANQHEINII